MTVDRNPSPVDGANPSPGKSRPWQFPLMFLLLVAVIGLLMRGSFSPDKVLWSNDGPLGRLMSECHHLPEAFTGTWEDLNAAGYREQGALPNITCGLRLLLKPVWFAKFYALIALFILGLAAWCFFRQLGLAPPACILGGLAATLNSAFFSDACWGVAGHTLAVAMTFLALAALMKTGTWRGWLRAAVAGLAVGMGLAEGADIGVLFSMCVSAFVLYQAWIAPGARKQNIATGAGRLATVVVFAAFLAAYAISALLQTQVQGVSGMQQDTETRDARWNWATQWSLPRDEALSLIVPGLFGYRLDTPNGGAYWGAIGRDLEWTRFLEGHFDGQRPHGILRQTGGGIYAGITVALIAVWAMLQSFRKRDSAFGLGQRRWLWFWVVLGLVSLLLGFGRYAPFYQIVYALPFTSTMRNPVKFLALVNFAIVVLFAYGVDGLWRKYMTMAAGAVSSPWLALKRRWTTPGSEKNWLLGCLLVLAIGLAAWGLYALSRESLMTYLQTVAASRADAAAVSSFSIATVGWFVLFFALAAALVALIISGVFSGPRARWGIILLGLLLALDLGRANQPWIFYWNYKEKYASNPIVDLLRDKPFEHRAILLPFQMIDDPDFTRFSKVFRIEWAQHLFQYYNIQSSDVVQLPRVPADMKAFDDKFYYDGTFPMMHRLFRRWELTNTRFALGVAAASDDLNLHFDPIHQRFRIVTRFNLVACRAPSAPLQVDNYTTESAPDGKYALYEFTGALPRAKLFSNWQIDPDETATLNLLENASFDPGHTVLVSEGMPANVNSVTNANPDAGAVEITSYSSREVRMKANATAPAVLLLNDKFDPAWHVSVDGQPATMLRCNALMRGVFLDKGEHAVDFTFQPQAKLFPVSVAAIGFAGILLLVLFATEIFYPAPEPKPASAAAPATAPRPAPTPVQATAALVKAPTNKKRRGSKSKA